MLQLVSYLIYTGSFVSNFKRNMGHNQDIVYSIGHKPNYKIFFICPKLLPIKARINLYYKIFSIKGRHDELNCLSSSKMCP
jgi:hypothetical protein